MSKRTPRDTTHGIPENFVQSPRPFGQTPIKFLNPTRIRVALYRNTTSTRTAVSMVRLLSPSLSLSIHPSGAHSPLNAGEPHDSTVHTHSHIHTRVVTRASCRFLYEPKKISPARVIIACVLSRSPLGLRLRSCLFRVCSPLELRTVTTRRLLLFTVSLVFCSFSLQ